MNWFRQNRFLGTFLMVCGAVTIASAVFLWRAKSGRDAAQARFDESATELIRLQRLSPFPNETNLQKMKTQAQDYAADLAKLKEDLKTKMLPIAPIAPNEFQTRLNQARAGLTEKARANKVKLPENFFLGFEEFAAALPDTEAAPLLGQELAQVELILNILIDARVDAINSLRRVPLAERAAAVATPAPVAGRPPPTGAAKSAPLIERNVIDLSFTAPPGAARRILNQIATVDQQLFVVRTLHAMNEKEKGPPREGAGAAASAPPPGATPAANSALNFIVGNEHIQAGARIEMLRFTF
jgi:hypothetical protein